MMKVCQFRLYLRMILLGCCRYSSIIHTYLGEDKLMSETITWLNSNQGFVMSILTCVYVVATIVIVVYTGKSIKELEKTREEESRPYIFANLQKDPRDVCFFLRVKNYGKTGGRISQININPNLKFADNLKVEDFLNNTILAPGQSLQFIIMEQNNETSKRNYDVTISYTPTFNDNMEYSEKYNLVTQYASQMGYTDNKKSNLTPEANAINNIAHYLDAIRHKL